MPKRFPVRLALAVLLVLSLTLAPLRAAEPANLTLAKETVHRYLTSGAYGEDLTKVAVKAGKHLAKRVARPLKAGEKRAIVFDIDETTLTNLSHITANDYGYVPEVWSRWTATGQARAIIPVQLIYDVATHNQVAVFFITGRGPAEAAATERNLRETGYATWEKIYYKPDDHSGTARGYKTEIRRQLAAQGYTILLNIGDQESDLAGGFAEATFKLPNPFYLIR
ncbi:HAD superfamily, subfamily IIIB (Acid phosphatase) [Lacunisphaera limnophila]|uniref:HAD superfamily, subfamily IIIB (Acid phosphatase) n=1 Tax=Lacunisphaera limnophila TaxID=1838286 RepID=A0A1I7PI26_9BACT|nr:HAD family acid phosphatase [Lacunisphaera limnophila]AOS43280.1 HAD superfamily, subfamily IIIB (Acid phosphatase) [Lacunisphaera limnophila]